MTLCEHRFNTGELDITYAESEGKGPCLVLLHGLGGDWHGFEDMMEHCASGWHQYACNLRGHAGSGRDSYRYRLVDYTRDIAAFVRSLGTPVVVLGHSLGALIALAAAARITGRIRGLVLLDPPLFIRNTAIEEVPGVRQVFSWAYETVKGGATIDEIAAQCRTAAPTDDAAVIKHRAEDLSRLAPEIYGIALRNQTLDGIQLTRVLKEVHCPVLLLHGDWSSGAMLREEDLAWFKEFLPHSTLTRIPGGSHHFLWERAQETYGHIDDFLRKQ